MYKGFIVAAIRIIIGVVFLLSGIIKLTDVHLFTSSIKNFGFVPDPFIGFLSVAVPVVELLSGLFLLLGFWIRLSSGVVIGVLIIFIAAIIPNIAIGNEIDCGCFGPLSQSKVGIGLLVRDFIMLGLTLTVFSQQTHKLSLDNLIVNNRD
jgi:putative oxidoreductase